MRRFAAILLIGTFLALGGGVLGFAHNLQHVHESGAAGHTGDASHRSPTPGHEHDLPAPADCFVHGLLHAPMLSTGAVPLLVCLGLFVAFLSLLAERPAAIKLLARLNCRGPPALA